MSFAAKFDREKEKFNYYPMAWDMENKDHIHHFCRTFGSACEIGWAGSSGRTPAGKWKSLGPFVRSTLQSHHFEQKKHGTLRHRVSEKSLSPIT